MWRRSVTITLPRIDVHGVHAELAERVRHDQARQPLAVARNRIDRARRQLAQHGEPLHQLGQLLKMLVEDAFELQRGPHRSASLRACSRWNSRSSRTCRSASSRLPADRIGGERQQAVGGLAHGRNHHHRPAREARFDDRRHPFDGGRRFDRRAAEFHHDHCVVQSRNPSEYISSAFEHGRAGRAADRVVAHGDELPIEHRARRAGGRRRRPCRARAPRRAAAADGPARSM